VHQNILIRIFWCTGAIHRWIKQRTTTFLPGVNTGKARSVREDLLRLLQQAFYRRMPLHESKKVISHQSTLSYSLRDAMADDADWQISSVTSSPPTHRELRHVIVQLMTSRSRAVSLQRSTILSSEMYVSQAPGGTTGFRHPNAAYTQNHPHHNNQRGQSFSLANPARI